MKKIFLYMICLLAVGVSFTACSDDDDDGAYNGQLFRTMFRTNEIVKIVFSANILLFFRTEPPVLDFGAVLDAIQRVYRATVLDLFSQIGSIG